MGREGFLEEVLFQLGSEGLIDRIGEAEEEWEALLDAKPWPGTAGI